jgi:hypothetical protein
MPALAWLTSPAAAAATGRVPFDVDTLLRTRATVYRAWCTWRSPPDGPAEPAVVVATSAESRTRRSRRCGGLRPRRAIAGAQRRGDP